MVAHDMEEPYLGEPGSKHPTHNTSRTTNNDGAMLLDNMQRLSLSTAAATALPPSSPINPAVTFPEHHGNPSPCRLDRSTKSPLRRAPSSSSLGGSDRSITPTLHKRASLSSLQGSGGGTSPRSSAFRRTSAHLASSPGSGVGMRSQLSTPVEEPLPTPATAASVASEFFAQELSGHRSGDGKAEEAQTIVILQDDCYGHRYSRPRTSKANLNTIVERPERIQASILGLAMAYVRLGGRHAEGKAPPLPRKYLSPLPSVPFKIHKTARRLSLKSPAAVAIHGAKWMDELSAMCDAAESKLVLSGKELTRPSVIDQTNGKTQIERPKLHEGDLYLCSESLNALEGALGGVCEGVDTVFNERGPKRAFICIRPPGHHCSTDMPSGFCWLNNVHVGIGHAALTHGLTHAAIIDFDLHHGDGSQSITWAHNLRINLMPKSTPLTRRTAIGYFSLHDINSYPCEMGDEEKIRNASLCIENAHGQTIWNVHLQPWKTEVEFWQLYEERYSVLLTKARDFLRTHSDRLRQAPTHPKPKAAIFLSAGFDASEWESPEMQRHQVHVPTDFYARLTRDVLAIAEEEGLGVEGRVISVLEGGYSDRALMSGVFSHISGLATATGTSKPTDMVNGLGLEMGRTLGKPDLKSDSMLQDEPQKELVTNMDSKWWSLPHLAEIEALTKPPGPPAPSKKQRHDTRPTYTSATQSYTAKIISPPEGRRSVSGSSGVHQPGPVVTRLPSPPPPAVDWATAAHELSKLLIPCNRETGSCKPEDLNAEASRARRDRYSSIELPTETSVLDPKRMQLRIRKGKPPQYASDEDDAKLAARTTRRKTIADATLLAENVEPSVVPSKTASAVQPSRPTRRRSSVASTASSTTAERGSNFSLRPTHGNHVGDKIFLKRARDADNPHHDAPKVKASTKQAAVPRASSVSSAASYPENQVIGSQDTFAAPLAAKDDAKNKDVDQLAFGMRKMSIKLNMPPKSDYEVHETKAKAAPRGRPAKSSVSKTTKPVSPTKAKPKITKGNALPRSSFHELLVSHQFSPTALDLGPAETILEPVQEPKVVEQPLQPKTREVLEQTPTSLAPPSELFARAYIPIAATSADLPTRVTNQEESKAELLRVNKPLPIQQQLSHDLIPPYTPVTTKRTKQDLPVFTSTCPISFGMSNALPSIGQAMNANEYAIQQPKPEDSPPAQVLPAVASTLDLQMEKTPENCSRPQSPVRADMKQAPQQLTSIWDVPDTPEPGRP